MSARLFPALACALIAALSGCASSFGRTPADISADTWGNRTEQSYLLAPGDRIDVVVHTAPELSRELVVAPDGLVQMPLIGPVMAMARTPEELAASLRAALSHELINPDLDVMTIGFASPKVFIGGEVRAPGVFDLPAQIDPAQAISMAGGLTQDAVPEGALLIRRLPGGEVRSIRVEIRSGLTGDSVPLRRFDVLYVPESRLVEEDTFVRQYIRDALPLPFRLFYDISE